MDRWLTPVLAIVLVVAAYNLIIGVFGQLASLTTLALFCAATVVLVRRTESESEV